MLSNKSALRNSEKLSKNTGPEPVRKLTWPAPLSPWACYQPGTDRQPSISLGGKDTDRCWYMVGTGVLIHKFHFQLCHHRILLFYQEGLTTGWQVTGDQGIQRILKHHHPLQRSLIDCGRKTHSFQGRGRPLKARTGPCHHWLWDSLMLCTFQWDATQNSGCCLCTILAAKKAVWI